MISLDTETTGVDLHHGAKPFLVTTCNEQGVVRFWEWDVDPFTRQPVIPSEDLDEIADTINPYNNPEADRIILQNAKFDVAALATIRSEFGEDWQWDIVEDTLISAHLLASNQPKDLTTLGIVYLGENIQKYEDAVVKACKEARALVRTKGFIEKHGQWRIADKNLPEMPSAKEKVSKYDMWLPRAVCRVEGYAEGHPWWTVTSQYANADSQITLPLHIRHREILEERDLWEIYRERLKVLRIAYGMEQRGVTVNATRLNELREKYTAESARAGRICSNIAADYGYELKLPKSGNNNSLKTFVFDVMKLPAVKKTKAGQDSLDKNVLEHYEATLPLKSKPLLFVQNLRGKRSRDTAVSYLDSYETFWQPWACVQLDDPATGAGWYVLHPSLNPTGTDTLRWSSSNPNEQNISKKEGFNLRYCFGPAPGREWWSCDANNIELRIPAYEAGETAMIELFERPNDPPYFGSNHLFFFDILHPDKWDRNDPQGLLKAKKKYASTWYQWTKNGDFAVQYGAVAESGTADRAYHVPGAQARIESRLGEIKKLSQRQIEFAEKYGYVETIPDKTVNPRRGYPLLCTRTNYGRILPTVPLSYHVQGTAMWWMMKAKIRCQNFFDQLNNGDRLFREIMGRQKRACERLGYHIVMQIHDEMVFDFPRGVGAETWRTNKPIMDRVRKLMEKSGDDISIPTPVGCEYHGETWSVGMSV